MSTDDRSKTQVPEAGQAAPEASEPRRVALPVMKAGGGGGCGGGGCCGSGCGLNERPAVEPIAPPPTVSPEERRGLLRKLFGALTGLTAIAVVPAIAGAARSEASEEAAEEAKAEAAPEAEAKEKAAPKPKARWGMAIDLDKCTGCGGCVVACQEENNVAPIGAEFIERTEPINWMTLLERTTGTYPDLKAETLPLPCLHCDDAPCVKVCPVGATYVSEEGIVAQLWDRCIGCRYCMAACPYSRRYFTWSPPTFPESERNRLNPDVATRPAGVVEKCTFCVHRIRAVREQARVNEETLTDNHFRYLPACAQSCPARAITFGDLNDPNSEVSRLHKSPRAEKLLEELGTKPKVVYLSETKWRD